VDGASLRLLGELVSGSESRNMLIICAYRHNEVPKAHPFQILLDKLAENSDVAVTALHLEPLAFEDLSLLVGDSCEHEAAAVEDLSRLIEAKTAGNPFFVTQFLRTLADDRMLKYDHDVEAWQWDLDDVNAMDAVETVVDLMVSKMRRYGEDAQLLISLAACLGNTFDLETLSIISELDPRTTAQGLWEPLRDGLLFPLDRSYRYYQWSEIDHEDAPAPETVLYKFAHDRIQESSLRLIADGEFEQVNLNIGRLLYERLDAEEREERLFDLANHFNTGREHITATERALLITLNLDAGLKAKEATAFSGACEYITHGMNLLADDAWATDLEQTFLLHRERVDTEFLSGNFEAAESWFNVARQGTQKVRHLGDLFQLMIRIWLQADRVVDATELGIEACGVFGIDLPDSAEERDALIAQELQVFDDYMEGRELTELMERPLMDDPDTAVILSVLHETWSAAVMAGNGHVVAWSALKTITVALEQGNSVYSSGGYIALAHILSIHHRYHEADAIGRMALEMAQRFNDPLLIPKVNNTYCNFVSHLVHHTNICLPIYEESYRNALLSGDSWWGSWAVGWLRCARLICGYPLEEVLDTGDRYHEYIVSSNYAPLEHYSSMDRQIVLCLLGRTETPFSFKSDDYDPATGYMEYFQATGFGYALHLNYLYKAWIWWLHGRNEGTPELLELAEKHKDHIPLLMPWPDHFFYTPIVLAPHVAENPEHLETMKAHLAQLQHWQENNPANFDHRVALVQAEIARVTGDEDAAFDLYEVAIAKAKEHEYTQHEAMANELAGRLWLSHGRDRAALGYLLEAHLLYGRWGAATKVAQLTAEFPRLLSRRETRSSGNWATVSNSTTVELHDLDLVTVMKVSQAISGELNLSRLLDRMLTLSLENAGAQRATLVMVRDGRAYVEAQAELDGELERPSEPLSRSTRVPRTAAQYVLRTSESVVVDSVADDRVFGSDPYFRKHPVKSLMCVPSIKHNRVVAVLILENDSTAGAFTNNHLQLLNVLSGQMAIALDNAVLYDTMEQKVEERTEQLVEQAAQLEARNAELQTTQSALVQAEKMASLGQLVAGVAHEINNPITFVSSGLPSLRRDVDKIIARVPEDARDRRFDKIEARIGRLIDAIAQGAERTASVVQDLRVFSRHDEAAFKHADLQQALDATMTLQNHRLLKIELVRDYGDLPEVECYISQMNQVFMNLISNAIEAMDGTGTLTLSTRRVGEEVHIGIADTGTGMDAATVSKVFDHFFTTKGVGEGTGLGLSISHKIALSHAGRIEVESELGVGTTFRVCIPIEQEDTAGAMG
jgi:histidine kinase